jgi:23S rRNA (guanosine2251-2'-O)-methyltransferase
VFGLHAVLALIETEADRVRAIWVQDSRREDRVATVLAQAASRGITVEVMPRRTLDARLPGLRHQGLVAWAIPPARLGEADLQERLSAWGEAPLLLALDGVQDPHNLGACLRTAWAAGVQGVIVPADRAVGLTPVVRKVAVGAAEHVPLFQVTNLARTLRMLGDAGFRILGADAHASQSLYQADLSGPLVWVLGAEGSGLRRLTQEACDLRVTIPLDAAAESLNVSVAAGVVLFETRRRRLTAD